MTRTKPRVFLSLFLILMLVVSALPTAAFAADAEDTHTHEEVPASESEIVLDEEAPNTYEEKLAMMAEDTESAEPGYIEWLLDQNNILHIGGYGYIADFTSADDQPWKCQREQITAVMFDGEDQPEYDSTDYWFDGCTNLDPENIFDYEMCLLLKESAPYAYSDCGVTGCTCTSWCTHEYRNYRTAENPDQYHIMTVYCAGCGVSNGIIVTGAHSFSGNTCTLCGYTKSCSHTSTTQRYITGCDWQRICNSCGAVVSTGTTHGPYTYGSWYYYSSSYHRRSYTCSYGDSGTYYENQSHSTTTTYGQYSSTQHSVNSYCSTCGTTISSSYVNHSFTYGSWENYSSSQHRRTKSCSTCGYSTYEYASHSLSYGSWSNYDASQHRRSVSCSCGYSSYEYASHSLVNGSWASASDTQHSRKNTCSCGYSTTETENHTLTYGDWDWVSEENHSRTKSCSCGYSGTETAAHTWIPGQWEAVDSQQHKRPLLCTCGETIYETADHTDTDDDGYCDNCDYLLTHFSVTVPASMALAMADNGEIYTATDVAIVNYSTGAVKVTGVTVTANGGWTIVPYNYNMAAAKVDSRQIGFAVNGAHTTIMGNTEALDLGSGWEITKGASLPLTYDAIVSATSQVIQAEQVLTLVFVIDWAA